MIDLSVELTSERAHTLRREADASHVAALARGRCPSAVRRAAARVASGRSWLHRA